MEICDKFSNYMDGLINRAGFYNEHFQTLQGSYSLPRLILCTIL